MINLNPAIEQKINEFILKVKLAHQKEATDIIQETKNLKDELIQELCDLILSDPSFRLGKEGEKLEKQITAHTDRLVQTINLLSTGESSETTLDNLSQETDSLVAKLFDDNANAANFPELKENITAWQTKVKGTLVKISTTVKLQKKNESLIAELKDNLDKYSSIPEVDEPFEKLVKEFKDNFAQLQEASVLFQTLDDLINEIKANEVIKLNKRIDILLEKTKEQVAGFPPELDREVQGELAKLIKILGIAQVELMNISKPCDIMQVKSVVDAEEIAIKSLTGQPNIVLAQKLRYAATTGLREIQKGSSRRLRRLANFTDNLFHSFKIPTKVLIGLVFAFPVNWFIMNFSPVKELLFLPPIIKSSSQNTQGEGNQNTQEEGNQNTPGEGNQNAPGEGNQNTPGEGNQNTQGKGNQNTPGEGNQNAQGEGNQNTPGEGNQNTQGKGNQNTQGKGNQNTQAIIRLMWITGTLGGGVSLLTRLQDFDNPKNQKYDDDLLPLLIGLTKPILGGSFAFFIMLILQSNIFPIQIRSGNGDKGNDTYLLLAMAFVAGFSERLIPDLISQVEKKVTVEASSTGQGLPPDKKG